MLREAFASDWVTSLVGIVNGTCNYVLTRMRENGLSFDAAVKEAQAKGYAEADPSLDVDGHDAAHKLVVLAMLAFGARVEARAGADRGDPRHRSDRSRLRRPLRLRDEAPRHRAQTRAKRSSCGCTRRS